MQLFKSIRISTLLVALTGISLPAFSQTYSLPKAHTAEHRDLIAAQENINNRIKVENTHQFLDNI